MSCMLAVLSSLEPGAGRLSAYGSCVQMVLETRSALESGVQGSGHSFAATRLDAQRSIAGWVAEQTGGLSYLESIRQLAKRVDDDWEGVQADLQSIRRGDLMDLGGLAVVVDSLVCSLVTSADH